MPEQKIQTGLTIETYRENRIRVDVTQCQLLQKKNIILNEQPGHLM